MNIEILGSAQDDLVDGWHFYEAQSEGIGDYFLDSIYATIDSLRIYAGTHEKHFGRHRMLANNFPYAIYYHIENHSIIRVEAVLDTRKNPLKTKTRFS